MIEKYAHISLLDNLPPKKDGSFNFLIYDIINSRKTDISISYQPEYKNSSKSNNDGNFFFIKKKNYLIINNRIDNILTKLLSPWIQLKDSEIKYFVRSSIKILNNHGIDKVIIWGFPNLVGYFRAFKPDLFIVFAQRHFEYSNSTNPYEYANVILMQNYGQYKRAFEKYLQIPTPVYIIPNGAELDIFKPNENNEKSNQLRIKYGINSKDFVILFPSKFAPHKGAFILPNLIKQLISIDNSFKLVIVGSKHPKYSRGKFIQDYALLEQDINLLNNNIIWINDGINRNEMVHIYNIADVAIFPNVLKEGFSMAATESLCCGIPILASNSGCFLEIIKNDYNGYLLEQSNLLAELFEKIVFLSKNPEILNTMKKNAREYGVKYLSREKVIKNFNYYLSGESELIDSRL